MIAAFGTVVVIRLTVITMLDVWIVTLARVTRGRLAS